MLWCAIALLMLCETFAGGCIHSTHINSKYSMEGRCCIFACIPDMIVVVAYLYDSVRLLCSNGQGTCIGVYLWLLFVVMQRRNAVGYQRFRARTYKQLWAPTPMRVDVHGDHLIFFFSIVHTSDKSRGISGINFYICTYVRTDFLKLNRAVSQWSGFCLLWVFCKGLRIWVWSNHKKHEMKLKISSETWVPMLWAQLDFAKLWRSFRFNVS